MRSIFLMPSDDMSAEPSGEADDTREEGKCAAFF